MCLVDGSKPIAVPIICDDQELVHFNSLWCHLFHVLSSAKGMTFFQISPSKNMTISGLFDRVFPAINSTQNQPSPFITTKTVAYVFCLIIDSVTLHHSDAPHSRALEHEATILKELDSMPPAAFRAELRAALNAFYEGILKIPGAGGRPEAKIIKRRFAGQLADVPPADPSPPPAAAGPPSVEIASAAVRAGSASREATPAPPAAGEAAAAAEAEPAAAPAAKGSRVRGGGVKGSKP
jgi:hypothetical protein